MPATRDATTPILIIFIIDEAILIIIMVLSAQKGALLIAVRAKDIDDYALRRERLRRCHTPMMMPLITMLLLKELIRAPLMLRCRLCVIRYDIYAAMMLFAAHFHYLIARDSYDAAALRHDYC